MDNHEEMEWAGGRACSFVRRGPNVDARPPVLRPCTPDPAEGWMQQFFLDVARFCMQFYLNGQRARGREPAQTDPFIYPVTPAARWPNSPMPLICSSSPGHFC